MTSAGVNHEQIERLEDTIIDDVVPNVLVGFLRKAVTHDVPRRLSVPLRYTIKRASTCV